MWTEIILKDTTFFFSSFFFLIKGANHSYSSTQSPFFCWTSTNGFWLNRCAKANTFSSKSCRTWIENKRSGRKHKHFSKIAIYITPSVLIHLKFYRAQRCTNKASSWISSTNPPKPRKSIKNPWFISIGECECVWKCTCHT